MQRHEDERMRHVQVIESLEYRGKDGDGDVRLWGSVGACSLAIKCDVLKDFWLF